VGGEERRLLDADRIVVEGFPLTSYQPYRPGRLLPPGLLQMPHMSVFVADFLGVPSGACLTVTDMHGVGGVYWVAVLPEHRSAGIGRALMRALWFSPDEWMIPIFGESGADGKGDLLEGLLINAGLCALAAGTNVVLDFGFWGRDERSACVRSVPLLAPPWRSSICRLKRRPSASVSRSAFSPAPDRPSRSRTLTSISGVPSSRNRPPGC
jgi:GNAT superfamily N-acetyltransferase